MAELVYEGVVIDGVIQLASGVSLPEKANVYVVVPDPSPVVETFEITLPERQYRILSPRLVDPSQASRFVMEVQELDRADV